MTVTTEPRVSSSGKKSGGLETMPAQGLTPLPPPRRKGKKRKQFLALVIGVGLVVGATLAVVSVSGSRGENDVAVLTYTVAPQSFPVNIPLSGELKAIRNVEVRCQVEGQTTILALVAEGKQVKAGEELVRLASDAIKDKVEDARIRVENARAGLVNAQQSLTIQQKQNESDITAADTNAKLAKLEFDQFDQGDSRVEIATRTTAHINAQTDLKRKTEDMTRVKELAASGFVSSNDVLDAEIALRDSQNKLGTATMDLEVWNKYAEPKQRQTLERKRDEATKEMERTEIKAHAAILLKDADVRAKESTLRVESTRLAGLELQLANCVIIAPQPGLVVYQSSVAPGWGGSGPIEEGAQVRQNQVLIQLPDLSHLLVEVRIAEQLLDRVLPGQAAVVTIDAMPGKVMTGKVDKISPLADGTNRWMNPNLKEYPTQIVLDGTLPGLKPGMSARVEINVANLQDVVAVPIQAVFVGGGESYVYVGNGEKYERRVVKTGLSSADKIEIKEGLQNGEMVLLSKPKGAADDNPSKGAQPQKKKKDKPEGEGTKEGVKNGTGNGAGVAS